MAATPATTPARIPRFPYTLNELKDFSKSSDARYRRPAKMSLWLRSQPEPPMDSSPGTLAMVARLDQLSRQAVADCDNRIARQEAQRSNMSPRQRAICDIHIGDLKYERNYMWWRFFRINALPTEIFTNYHALCGLVHQ